MFGATHFTIKNESFVVFCVIHLQKGDNNFKQIIFKKYIKKPVNRTIKLKFKLFNFIKKKNFI